MFCEKCGAKLEDGSIFCSECGHKLTDVEMPDESMEVEAPELDNEPDEEESFKTVALDMEIPEKPANTPQNVNPIQRPGVGAGATMNPINPIQRPGTVPVKKPVIEPKKPIQPIKKVEKPAAPITPIKKIEEPKFSFEEDENKTVSLDDINRTVALDEAFTAPKPVNKPAPMPLPPSFEEAPKANVPVNPVYDIPEEKPEKKKSVLPIVILIILIFLLAGVGGGAAYYFLVLNAGDSNTEKDDADSDDEDEDEGKGKDKGDKDADGEKETGSEEEKVDVKAVYTDFFDGKITASFDGSDYSFTDLMQYIKEHDDSFDNSPVFGYRMVKSAYGDKDGDGVDELFISVVYSDGVNDGGESIALIKYNEGKLEVLTVVITADEAEKSDLAGSASLEYGTLSEKYWSELKVNADAMRAYDDYLNSRVTDNYDKHLNELYGDNGIDYYYILADGNDIPMLIFRDAENKFPAAAVVYYDNQIVRSIFYEKWTFTTVDAGSYGGMYNNVIYTSKMPWEVSDDPSNPRDMVFYTIDLNTFMNTATTRVVICASENDYNGGSYDSYLSKLHNDFPEGTGEGEYRYYYTDGSGYHDKDAKYYDSIDAICDVYGGDTNYTASTRFAIYRK